MSLGRRAPALLLAAIIATSSPAIAGQSLPAPQAPSSSPFFGSVPKGAATAEPLPLSVKDAVQRALQNNLGLLLQEESEESAGRGGARWPICSRRCRAPWVPADR